MLPARKQSIVMTSLILCFFCSQFTLYTQDEVRGNEKLQLIGVKHYNSSVFFTSTEKQTNAHVY